LTAIKPLPRSTCGCLSPSRHDNTLHDKLGVTEPYVNCRGSVV